jgi:transposase
VEFIPARLVKHVHIEKAYECRSCKVYSDKAFIKSGTTPKPAIQNSLAGPSVLAWLFHQKIEMSLPFHRQESEWARYGLNVSRRTLSNWFIRSAQDWLTPIYDRMKSYLLKEDILHADETVYQILRRSDGKPATSDSRIWLFRNSQHSETPIILYHSSLTRKGEVASNFLHGFKGYLHCDGYTGYNKVPDVILSACWAHVRRKFIEAGDEYGKSAIGVKYCTDLFMMERKIMALPEHLRLAQRQIHVKPLVERFWKWLDSFKAMKGNLSKAINYALKLKESLMRFLEDGRLVISNNIAEQAIRPLTVGRKNWNFSTSEEGAGSLAIAYSIIQTAKANGLDPYNYLKNLFEKLPNLPFHSQPELLDEFLPWSSKMKLTAEQNK